MSEPPKIPEVIRESFQEAKKEWFEELTGFYKKIFAQITGGYKHFKFSAPHPWVILITIICLSIIVTACIYFVNTSYGNVVRFLSNWGVRLFKFSLPLLNKIFPKLIKLLVLGLKTLWLPALIYIGIHIFVKPKWFRFLLFLTIICSIYLVISQTLRLRFDILSAGLCIYFFILLVPPRIVWTWMSGSFIFVLGLALAMLPDIPIPFIGGTIDYGIFSAFFVFIFFFLHNLASLTKLFADILGDNLNLQSPKTVT